MRDRLSEIPAYGGRLDRTCQTPGCKRKTRRASGRYDRFGQPYYTRFCDKCAGRRTSSGPSKDKRGYSTRLFDAIRSARRCGVCGLKHEDASFFDVHHVDGNCKNNDSTNLLLVCPNCHRRAHLGALPFGGRYLLDAPQEETLF